MGQHSDLQHTCNPLSWVCLDEERSTLRKGRANRLRNFPIRSLTQPSTIATRDGQGSQDNLAPKSRYGTRGPLALWLALLARSLTRLTTVMKMEMGTPRVRLFRRFRGPSAVFTHRLVTETAGPVNCFSKAPLARFDV